MRRNSLGTLPAKVAASLFLMAAASACGGDLTERPFAKSQGPQQYQRVVTVRLISLNGLPDSANQQFRSALAASGSKRNIAIIEGASAPSPLGLKGKFKIHDGGTQVGLFSGWVLSDATGRVLHRLTAEEIAPAAAGEMWRAITPAVLQRVAASTAESLSSRLSQLGYATQPGGVPPPLDSFVLARPGAEKDIDLETLLGPGRDEPAILAASRPIPEAHGQVSNVKTFDDEATANGDADFAETGSKSTATRATSDPVIKAVAVVPVKGSPGSGNADLTDAMRHTLKIAGWPVVKAPRADALTIGGKVKVGKTAGATQQVSIAWVVSAPNGKILGTITQANTIPAGAIDQGWGDDAVLVAEAAATGIFDLVQKLRQ